MHAALVYVLGEWMDERVDLAADFRRVFGGDPPVAVAVSSDSDDASGRNRVPTA
jgi:hypothetical protein